MKKLLFSSILIIVFGLLAASSVKASWQDCTIDNVSSFLNTVSFTDGTISAAETDTIYYDITCPQPSNIENGDVRFSYNWTSSDDVAYFRPGVIALRGFLEPSGQIDRELDLSQSEYTALFDGDNTATIQSQVAFEPAYYFWNNFKIQTWVEDPEPSPSPSPSSTINITPNSSNVTVGTPFSVSIVASSSEEAFNAVQATVTVSTNLDITGIANATSNSCNLNYTETPTTENPSFAGAIFNNSSQDCVVYTMTLTPNEAGTGSITLSNGSLKSYSSHDEILDDVSNTSYTINVASPTPSPSPLSQLTINYPFLTYASNLMLNGTRDVLITQVFINGSDANTVYPSSTTWEAPISLSLGENNFILYGKDAEGNQTATQNILIKRHSLGDINGDSIVNLIDASLFAVDWGKTENLTYVLSDMNDDGVVNLTDLSILAKLLTG